MYRIPIYHVRLVRDGSQTSARKKVDSPSTAAHVLQQYLDGADREHFVVLLLDTLNQIICIHTVTIGTLDASLYRSYENHDGALRYVPEIRARELVMLGGRDNDASAAVSSAHDDPREPVAPAGPSDEPTLHAVDLPF